MVRADQESLLVDRFGEDDLGRVIVHQKIPMHLPDVFRYVPVLGVLVFPVDQRPKNFLRSCSRKISFVLSRREYLSQLGKTWQQW